MRYRMKVKLFDQKSRDNTSIDAVRFFAALMIVFIHSNLHITGGLLGHMAHAFMPIARLAVPFFFAASGYFMFASDQSALARRCKKSIIKLLNIFILSSLLYFAFYVIESGSISKVFDMLTAKSIFNMAFFNQPVFNTVLWFVLALISVNFVFFVKAKTKINDWYIAAIAVILFVAGLFLGGNYSSVFGTASVGPIFYRSYLGMGLIFTTVGYFIHKYSPQLITLNTKVLLQYTVLSAFLYFVEYFAISRHNPNPADVYLMTPIVTFFSFIWLIKYPHLLKHSILPMLGATIALYIYIIHPLIIDSIGWFYRTHNIDVLTPRAAALRFIITLILASVIGYLYFILKKNGKIYLERIRNKSGESL